VHLRESNADYKQPSGPSCRIRRTNAPKLRHSARSSVNSTFFVELAATRLPQTNEPSLRHKSQSTSPLAASSICRLRTIRTLRRDLLHRAKVLHGLPRTEPFQQAPPRNIGVSTHRRQPSRAGARTGDPPIAVPQPRMRGISVH
jgi:hypothetical protein